MRKYSHFMIIGPLIAVLCLSLAGSQVSAAPLSATPVGTTFTYQGQLKDGSGNPITATCDFQFGLYDAAVGGNQIGSTQTVTPVAVTNGYFTVSLDFGSGAFVGDARWLQIAVRCPAGSGSYTTLSPLQPLTPAPYSLYALNAGLLDGLSATSFALAGHNHWGETWTGSGTGLTLSGGSIGLSGSGGSTGVVGTSTGGTGVAGSGTMVGVYGTTSNGYGVEGVGTSGGTGVVGTSTSGTGVNGSGSTGVSGSGAYGGSTGVYGSSSNGYGVEGASTGGTGVYGSGLNYGVSGTSSGSTSSGVYGNSTGTNGTGVYGTGFAYGVNGASTSGTGVNGSGNTGVSGTGQSTGVDGKSTTFGSVGVEGDDVLGYGVIGTGETGVQGTSTITAGNGVVGIGAVGVVGESTASGGAGIKGAASGNTGDYAGLFYGNVLVVGTFTATETKSAVVDTQDYGTRALYAVESPDVWFQDFGTGQLTNGKAVITIDPVFAETVNLADDYHVFLTPLGDCALYVGKKSPTSITVRAMGGQACSIAFDYNIVAKRLGYENVRLAQPAVEPPKGGGQ